MSGEEQQQQEQQQEYVSEVERSLLGSSNPIAISAAGGDGDGLAGGDEEVTVNGESGIWLNKAEVDSWSPGSVPLSAYEFHQDADPLVITKRPEQKLEHTQVFSIIYLRPPTPPVPGEIVINEEASVPAPPAPPLVLRQQPPRPETPAPIVVREAPPPLPPQVGRKVVTIAGKQLPPPPRKVVVERLAALPAKPQSVIIERWLPYGEVKRRVIFNPNTKPDPVVVAPRNVIVQWEAPEVRVTKVIRYLSPTRADPADYVAKYGESMFESHELPAVVNEFETPEGLRLAAESQPATSYELEGDIEALKLIDLEKEGLEEYRDFLNRFSQAAAALPQAEAEEEKEEEEREESSSQQVEPAASAVAEEQEQPKPASPKGKSLDKLDSHLNDLLEALFKRIDKEGKGAIRIADTEKIVAKLSSRLGQNSSEQAQLELYAAIDENKDGLLNLDEFKSLFTNLIRQ